MSRSGYIEDWDWDQESRWANIRWRGQVASSIRGKRGQALLKEALAAFDAMPVKELVADSLKCTDGVCTLGAVGEARGLDMTTLDAHDSYTVSANFDIADQLAREIVYQNDEGGWGVETPADRFTRMYAWVESHIKKDDIIET